MKSLFSSEPASANVIDLTQIDHIYKGHMCKRFQDVFDSSSAGVNSALSPTSSNVTVTSSSIAESTSLSIVYRESSSDFIESLDLIVPDPREYSQLVAALDDLLDVCRDEQRYYDRDLLVLRHHWIALDKDYDDGISLSEFDTLCQRLNVPLKKSKTNQMFRDHLKDLRKEYEIDAMPIWAVQNLLKEVKHLSNEQAGVKNVHHDPLSRIWHDILATDPVPNLTGGNGKKNGTEVQQSLEIAANNNYKSSSQKTISSVAFLSFIRSQQKEFGTTLEKSLQLMQSINSQTSSEDLEKQQQSSGFLSSKYSGVKGFGCESSPTASSSNDENNPANSNDKTSNGEDRLTKSRLFSYLLSDANDILDPKRGKIGSDDMTQPLSSYWINSSHDTYWNHSTQQLDENLYLAALYRGVRCLELDVWDGPNGKPVLARDDPAKDESKTTKSQTGGDSNGGSKTPGYLDITVALKAIRQFLLANPKSYPIILNLENHCSYCVQERLANQIFGILGSIGLIVVPDDSDSVDEADLLPSPASMKGKVLIMGKRPAIIQDGAKIVNDDFDDENVTYIEDYLPNAKSREEEEFESAQKGDNAGVVIGFDARGPIRSTNPSVVKHSPGELLYMAKQELEQAKIDAAEAELHASELEEFANKAEAHSDKLIAKAGLDKESVLDLEEEVRSPEIDPDQHVHLLSPRHDGEGVEIQEFFADAVEGARTGYAAADQSAIAAAEKATVALQRLNQVTAKLREAEEVLEKAYMKNQNLSNQYQRAAADARNKREHADQAERRVAKVTQLLKECQDSANSAENVVVTAMTEAKISEKRASETEARAARAASTAQSDRQKAEEETRKEEELEKQATALHEKVATISQTAKESRDRMEKASGMLDRVNEQIKLIESSSQYVRERQEYMVLHGGEEKKDSHNRRYPKGKVMQKHEAKLEERRLYAMTVTDASAEAGKIEAKKRTAQESFEKCAHMWKGQTEVATRARKQADRSTQLAEELAEHAEEEREAANLRHVAREKAKNNVSEKDAYKTSLKAQLTEARRAFKEAKKVSEEARVAAEEYAATVEAADPHEDLIRMMEKRRAARDVALEEYEEKKKIKDECDLAAEEAKRLFSTSEVVYSDAMRNAAKDARKADVQLVADRNAIVAFNRTRLAQKQADHALERARYVQGIVEEKNIYAKRAMEYVERMDKITEIPASLAKMTFLHTTKFKYWEKSVGLPNTHSHSFSQQVLAQMIERDANHPTRLKEFTVDHICRTFPNRKESEKEEKVINVDPLFQWAVGSQIVSMNYSVFDVHILKAEGRFRRNGSSGYVLKPESLLHYEEALPERPEAWTISVLCGSCIPSPDSKRNSSNSSSGGNINPLVILTVYGGAMQSKSASHRTRMVHKNGFNPVWDDQKGFTFKATTPSTSILVFQVYDRSENGAEEFIAAAAVPVSCIREGYRSVALFDRHHSRAGAHAHASLLVRAQKLTN